MNASCAAQEFSDISPGDNSRVSLAGLPQLMSDHRLTLSRPDHVRTKSNPGRAKCPSLGDCQSFI